MNHCVDSCNLVVFDSRGDGVGRLASLEFLCRRFRVLAVRVADLGPPPPARDPYDACGTAKAPDDRDGENAPHAMRTRVATAWKHLRRLHEGPIPVKKADPSTGRAEFGHGKVRIDRDVEMIGNSQAMHSGEATQLQRVVCLRSVRSLVWAITPTARLKAPASSAPCAGRVQWSTARLRRRMFIPSKCSAESVRKHRRFMNFPDVRLTRPVVNSHKYSLVQPKSSQMLCMWPTADESMCQK